MIVYAQAVKEFKETEDQILKVWLLLAVLVDGLCASRFWSGCGAIDVAVLQPWHIDGDLLPGEARTGTGCGRRGPVYQRLGSNAGGDAYVGV